MTKDNPTHEEWLAIEEDAKKKEATRPVVNLDDYPEVVCPCGHCCCEDCKCAESPDPVRGMTVCPCKHCATSKKPHDNNDYNNPRRIHPKNQQDVPEYVEYRNQFPAKHV